MSYLKVVMRNAVSNWANMAISLVISFFLAPFILHKVGNTYYGVWALVSQVTGYLWLLDFGVRDSVIKYVAEYHEKHDGGMLNDVINASLKLYSSICLGCIALTFLFAALFPVIFTGARDATSIARLLVIITGIDIALTFFFNVFIGILMGLQRYDVFSKISIALNIAKAFSTVYFLSRGYGVVSVCLIQFCANTCMNMMVYVVSRRLLSFKLAFRKYGKGKAVYRMIVNYSFFAFLNCIAMQIFSFSSNFIIAIFLPVSSVTFFAIAATLVEYMKKVILAGTQAFSPLTSQLDAKDDPARIATLLVKGSKFSLLLGLPVATVYLVMGKRFIGLWMGHEYSALTGDVLAVLTVMTIFSLPHYTISGIFLGLNRHRLTAYCRLVEAAANICLSVILVQRIGVLGAAFGLAIPHLVMVVLVLPVLATKIIHVRVLDYFRLSYAGPIISVIPFAVSCFLIESFMAPQSLAAFFVVILLLLPIYMVSAWFFAVSKEERRHCKETITAFLPAGLLR